ncbi:MAG TPA: hypothetical protein VFX42_10970, partial [Gemmatimonadales bacterium]|nr:hypothetical protein [Gemmatimonadales bacterium]
DRSGHTQLEGQVAGRRKPGAGAESGVPDGLTELVLDLSSESAGALAVYRDENVERPTGH